MTTLIEFIKSEIETDDSDSEQQSELLKSKYLNASAKEQEKMDEVTTCLCGWTLRTLIEKVETLNANN